MTTHQGESLIPVAFLDPSEEVCLQLGKLPAGWPQASFSLRSSEDGEILTSFQWLFGGLHPGRPWCSPLAACTLDLRPKERGVHWIHNKRGSRDKKRFICTLSVCTYLYLAVYLS